LSRLALKAQKAILAKAFGEKHFAVVIPYLTRNPWLLLDVGPCLRRGDKLSQE